MDSKVNTDVCPLFFQLGTADVLKLQLEMAGFHEVSSERIQTELYYATTDEALNAVFAAGPVAMAYSRFDEATKLVAHQEYRESIEEFQKDGSYHIPGEFVVVAGKKF